MGLPPRQALTWHATLPGSQRCLTFAGETFDVEMLGLDEALPFALGSHLWQWMTGFSDGWWGLEGGPLKKNRERSMWVESIPIKGVTVGETKYAHNFSIKWATYWFNKHQLEPCHHVIIMGIHKAKEVCNSPLLRKILCAYFSEPSTPSFFFPNHLEDYVLKFFKMH